MTYFKAPAVLAANGAAVELHMFGPVVADRIARIRARLADGRYPLDVKALAEALVAIQDREQVAAGIGRAAIASLSSAVAARLATTLRTMDSGAVLVLQLEFVEQLRSAEIATLVGSDSAAIGAVRRAALGELSGRLLEG